MEYLLWRARYLSKVRGSHLTRWIIFKSGKLSWPGCSSSAMWSEVNLIALIKTLESGTQNTFLLFLRMNLSSRNFLIPDSSQVNRFLRKLLIYSVVGATWFFHCISLFSEWRGSKKYEKSSSTEIISPSRDDPVLSKLEQYFIFSIDWHFTWGRPISGFSCLACWCCGFLAESSCSTLPILSPVIRLQSKMNKTSFWHLEVTAIAINFLKDDGVKVWWREKVQLPWFEFLSDVVCFTI